MSSRKPLDPDLYADVVAEAKERFDVWPSAYASGWVVKTYKERGGRYAGGDRKTRSGLTKWFGESWVDLSRPIHDEDGELVGYEPCGRKTAQGAAKDPAAYPKCRPLKEAMRMTPYEVKDAIARKRAAEAKAGGRGGRGARAPVRVSTYRENPALTLWRAADDDYIGDSTSFAESREVAELYLDNPGFGGSRLYRARVTPRDVLNLTGDDGADALSEALGGEVRYGGAIGIDEVVPRVAEDLRAAGYQWVRVPESYPKGTVTWIYVGGSDGDEPVLVEADLRSNPMREPGDVPGFRIAVLEHQKPGAFKGRIILAAYTDDGQMLAWLGALPATLRSSMSTSSGARAAAFPELDVNPYSPPRGETTVWEVAKAHAWVNGWGPLLYEALLAFVASKGYSGWVTSDAGSTSNEARAVWRRFSERDDVEFREDVGRNVSGEPIHAMRALPALLAKRAPLLKKLDRRAAYTRAARQFLRGDANQGSGRFVPLESEARANPFLWVDDE